MPLIESIADFIEENFLFPDMAQKLAQHLRESDYNGLENEALCEAVTSDLIRISHDQHMFLRYEAQQSPEQDFETVLKRHQEQLRFQNFGFQKFERFSGNIGYCKLNEVPPVDIAGKMFQGIMALLENTAAVIIDLSACEGGAPDMVQFIASHFVEANQPLSGIEERGANLEEWRTLTELESPRLLKKPLAVLISKVTFSAAEALAYDLQVLKRAVIIGETSRGGAHLSTFQTFEGKFLLRCSVARALNPISKNNWEGTGVIPNIASDTALLSAQKYLLEKLIAAENSPYQEQWQAALKDLG